MLFLIWADEKYNTQKNRCVVFATQKNAGVFHRPKKIPFGQNVRPQKILRTPPLLEYVSGAPGLVSESKWNSPAIEGSSIVGTVVVVGSFQLNLEYFSYHATSLN